MKRPFFILLSFYLVSGAACYAASTGASFLDIGTSARAIAMGGAFVGVADDVSAMNYNPAGLEQIQEGGVVAQHTEWISDLSHDFIAAAFPTKAGTFGAGIVYLSQGTLDGRDSNGIANGMFGANDLAVTASYSHLLTGSLAGGVNVKFIQETIANTTATGYAADMGILTPFLIPHLKAGVVLENIGPQMKFISEGYDLPASISAGLGYTVGPILLALDIKQSLYETATDISFGTEYALFPIFVLRAGYMLPLTQTIGDDNSSPIATGFGVGVGFSLLGAHADYAFVPYGDLGNTNRLSLSVNFK